MEAKYGGHIYVLERDCQVTCLSLIFADTGTTYTDVIGDTYEEHELIEALDDLIAQGEDDRDREAEDRE